MGENTRRSDDRVGALYAAYQDWRARVYDEFGPPERRGIGHAGAAAAGRYRAAPRPDRRRARARLTNAKGRGMNDNDTHNDGAAGEKPRWAGVTKG